MAKLGTITVGPGSITDFTHKLCIRIFTANRTERRESRTIVIGARDGDSEQHTLAAFSIYGAPNGATLILYLIRSTGNATYFTEFIWYASYAAIIGEPISEGLGVQSIVS